MSPRSTGSELTDASQGRGRPAGRRTGAPSARVTVNLTARSTKALEEAVATTGDTQTDVINRALQVYAYLESVMAQGDRVYVENAERQERERLRFF
ncbi:hypothetical protein GCM10007079_15900 [Nocardiopsis terrae]|uniref:Ribbon-helix-helix protein, copG family n=1 Tax=Nocardiopsis terrae TaxID=372655 RepID=A0ABR9HB22_9ACTN|nr:hypothetical protein [Nocardiopsis terrae]MBE1456207.1 hypothetical protein [Nocardiopsis terrae]GHC78186.1 hypothetical protein GCM10007079_15900 [Nocardiopsis terrae]